MYVYVYHYISEEQNTYNFMCNNNKEIFATQIIISFSFPELRIQFETKVCYIYTEYTINRISAINIIETMIYRTYHK